jgi:hypothetical protein
MPKIDKDGREYIEQDGKRYYRNFWGEWGAEKDWLGNDKVETDWLGNPKVETDWLGNPYVEPEKKDDSGCCLTTACMRALSQSFNDDCDELGTLRAFRDAYVKERHPEAVEEYYRVAPKIVAAISQREDSQSIYQKIYEELVLGTLRLIEQNLCEEAYTLYRDYSLVLNRTYC